jgi:outer membrane protein assembly factor BamB
MKLMLALVLVTALISPSSVLAEDHGADVLMYRGDPGRTGQMPEPGPDGTPSVLWEFQSTGPAPPTGPLAIHDSMAYFTAGAALLAVDVVSGKEIWRSGWEHFAAQTAFWRPAVGHGLVILSFMDGLIAFDATTGQEQWRSPLVLPHSSDSRSLIVPREDVVLVSAPRRLFALDAKTGRPQWEFVTGSEAPARLLVMNDVAYATSEGGTVFAIDAASGEERWRAEIGESLLGTSAPYEDSVVVQAESGAVWVINRESGEGRSFQSIPVALRGSDLGIVAGSAFLVNGETSIQAFDIDTERVLWRYSPGDSRVVTQTIVDDVVVTRLDDRLAGVDILSGTELWRSEFVYRGTTTFVADGVLYASDAGGGAMALDARTGAVRWQFGDTGILATPTIEPATPATGVTSIPTTGPGPVTSIAEDSGVVAFFGDEMLIGVDASSGGERWRFGPGGAVSPPVIADGNLYFTAASGTAHSLSAADGAERWSVALGGCGGNQLAVVEGQVLFDCSSEGVWSLMANTGERGTRFDVQGRIPRPPIVHEDVVYWLGFEGDLAALDVASGTANWSVQTEATAFFTTVMADNMIFLVTLEGRIEAYDAATGDMAWSTDSPVPNDGMAASDGRLFVMSESELVVLDTETGQLVWALALSDLRYGTIPAVADGIIVVGSREGTLLGLDATTPERLWHLETGQRGITSPVVSQGVVYFGSNDGSLHALDLHSGAEIWSIDLGSFPLGEPIVSGGAVYVGSYGGPLYAVG